MHCRNERFKKVFSVWFKLVRPNHLVNSFMTVDSAIVAMSKGQSLYPIIRIYFVCIADSVFPSCIRCTNLPLTFSVGVVDKILHKLLRGNTHRLSTLTMDSIEVREKESRGSIGIWKHPTWVGCFPKLLGNKDSSPRNTVQLLTHYLGRD